MDILAREDLSFPQSLPEFQRIFRDDTACAAYLEKARWRDGFRLPMVRCCRRALPFRGAPARSALPSLSQRRWPDGRNHHGAQPHTVVNLVLGGLFDHQSNTGNVGRTISATTWPVAL